MHTLRGKVSRIDGKGYKAYEQLRGTYEFNDFKLQIVYVQRDPYGPPSRLIVEVDTQLSGIPRTYFQNSVRKLALEDFLVRRFYFCCRNIAKGRRGSGNSGIITINHGGQEVIARSAISIDRKSVTARFYMGLPADGRTILGREAYDMLFNEVPLIVKEVLFANRLDIERLEKHVFTTEDYFYIRNQLSNFGLVAFIADGSILPRKAGNDPKPLEEGSIKFQSPPSLKTEIVTPHSGKISGLGIPKGVTVITGGGFHGKSTLLDAISKGVYPHVPGDGRELVVTLPDAVKIRAEDGRSVTKVDVSPFLSNLPMGKDTKHFSTQLASGSTSMAASIVEAAEAKARLLLIDEDTAANNFMIRDELMRKFLPQELEPITPFVDTIRSLWEDNNISTIIVTGGSGEYLRVADQVITMNSYKPLDETERSKQLVGSIQKPKKRIFLKSQRMPVPSSFNARKGRHEISIETRGLGQLSFGQTTIITRAIDQIAEESQLKAIGFIIYHLAFKELDGKTTMMEGVERIFRRLENEGFDFLQRSLPFDLSMPRLVDTVAVINRMRGISMRQLKTSDTLKGTE